MSEEIRLLSVCKPPMWNLVSFLLGTGIHVSQAIHLKWTNFDLLSKPSATVTFRTRGHRQPHAIPLPSDVRTLLLAMRRGAPPELEYVFLDTPTRNRRDIEGNLLDEAGIPRHYSYPYNEFKRVRAASGLRDISFRTLRQTYAMRLISAGVHLGDVALLLNRDGKSSASEPQKRMKVFQSAIRKLDKYLQDLRLNTIPMPDDIGLL